jgi:hypothetical protein
MRKQQVYKLIAPALLSVCFIVFTAIVSQGSGSLSLFGQFCFLFHTIPSDIGFLSGNDLIFWVYYPLLFVLLTLSFAWIGYLAKRLKSKYYYNR